MSEQTGVLPLPDLSSSVGSGEGEWIVVVFNNDHNTFEEVTGILQQATGCTMQEAEMETWEVHHLGRSIVHHAECSECERVAGIIRTIGIRVEVSEL